jgi:uncharacterized repeat protein (TIGR01451 family)
LSQTVNLPVGSTITYTVTGTLSGTASGNLSNVATVNTPAGVVDTNVTNNVAIDTDVIGARPTQADLTITKTNGLSSVTAGSTVTYVIVVTNNGPGAVTGATVTDTFSGNLTGVTFTAAGTGGASGFAGGNGTLNQTVNLPAGSTITYIVTGTVSPTATGSLSNTATVNAPAGVADANVSNNIATDTDVIAAATAQADLSITKSSGGTSVTAGDTVTYTIVVTNNGPTAVTGATVTDTLASSLTGVSFTATQNGGASGATSGTGNLNQVVNLPVGASVTYTVTGTLSDTATGSLSNTAIVTAPAGIVDVNVTNNVATDTDIVLPPTGGGGEELVCEVLTDNVEGAAGTAVLGDDADNPGSNVLLVTGTARNDVIIVEPNPKNRSQLRVLLNGKVIGTAAKADVSRIVAFGLEGNDKIIVNASLFTPATLFGGAGNDQLFGARGSDALDGGAGNDKLFGLGGNDLLCGGDGNDFIFGGAGNDFAGGDAGNDQVFGEGGNDILLGNDGNDKLFGGTGNDGLIGGAGNDQLFGESGNDALSGGEGNDKLFGGAGRDILVGGLGNDFLTGDAGDDILIGGETDFDDNLDAVQAIMAEWSSRNNYNTRVNNIRFGGGLNDPFTLDDSSVFDDFSKDDLIGGGNQDLFFVGNNDKLRDRAKNEQVA